MTNESVKTKIALAILLIAAFIVIGAHYAVSTHHVVRTVASLVANVLAIVGCFLLGGDFKGLRRTPGQIYADIKEGRQQRMTSLQRVGTLLAIVIMILSSTSYM